MNYLEIRELESSMTEMEKSPEGVNRRCEQAEESLRKCDNTTITVTETEQQKGKKVKKNKRRNICAKPSSIFQHLRVLQTVSKT